MVVGLWSIYDKLANETLGVFQSKNIVTAQRSAVNSLNSSSDVKMSDYCLVFLGQLDTEAHVVSVPKSDALVVFEIGNFDTTMEIEEKGDVNVKTL